MSWYDAISIVLSLAAIIISCITSLLVVFPHAYIHSICYVENKYILLLIVNSGFSPGLLFTEFGLVYQKGMKKQYEPIERTTFKPDVLLSPENMSLFWTGNFLKQVEAKKAIFLVLGKEDVLNKLNEIKLQNQFPIEKVQFYVTTSSLFRNNHTRKILSPSQKIKELIKTYENHPH